MNRLFINRFTHGWPCALNQNVKRSASRVAAGSSAGGGLLYISMETLEVTIVPF